MMGPFKKQKTSTHTITVTNSFESQKMAGNPREIGGSDSSDSEGDVDREEAHDAQMAVNPRNPPGHRPARVPIIDINHQIIDMNRVYWNQTSVAVLVD